MELKLSKGKAYRGSLPPQGGEQVIQIDIEPGHFFSLQFRSRSTYPRITVEAGSQIAENISCFQGKCATGTIDGERFRNQNLIARIQPLTYSGNFKLKLIDHGDLGSIRKKVIKATNRQRRKAGLDPLTGNRRLHDAAQGHVDDMDAVGRYLGHDSSDGRDLSDRIDEVGYKWRSIAENAASGQASPGAAVTAWMNSDGHRANLLDDEVKDIGIGFAIDDKSEVTYWIQKFANLA